MQTTQEIRADLIEETMFESQLEEKLRCEYLRSFMPFRKCMEYIEFIFMASPELMKSIRGQVAIKDRDIFDKIWGRTDEDRAILNLTVFDRKQNYMS